jgi:hypothetical protein
MDLVQTVYFFNFPVPLPVQERHVFILFLCFKLLRKKGSLSEREKKIFVGSKAPEGALSKSAGMLLFHATRIFINN